MMQMRSTKARRHEGTNGAVVCSAAQGHARARRCNALRKHFTDSNVAALKSTAESRQPTTIRAFTLIELLIAIAVLLVVIVATAQIFGTASEVAGTGHASAAIMQEAAVIERMLRDDLNKLSPEGFFAIRQVAVPNNVNAPGPLLNPLLPPNAWIRADQLVFFANGVESPQTARTNEQGRTRGQGLVSRIYYGHGFQLPNGPPYEWISIFEGSSFDPAEHVLPWHTGTVSMNRTQHETGGGTGTSNFSVTGAGSIPGNQPEARQWLLTRQPVLLVDDDQNEANANSKTVYLGEVLTERSIFLENFNIGLPGNTSEFIAYMIRNGRLDAAATRLDDIKARVQLDTSGNLLPWSEQANYISQYGIYYPRTERVGPSPLRADQALTNHVIGSAVSSFIVEWTWSDGTGDWYSDDGELLCEFSGGSVDGLVLPCSLDIGDCSGLDCPDRMPFGFYSNWHEGGIYEFQPEQPWFGLNLPDRGVGLYRSDNFQEAANFKRAATIFANNIEWVGSGSQYSSQIGSGGPPFDDYPGVRVYEAIFGYNRNSPTEPNPDNLWIDEPFEELAYTPWPSAIRVTIVLHDPQGRIEHGREFQFVIELPKRVRR